MVLFAFPVFCPFGKIDSSSSAFLTNVKTHVSSCFASFFHGGVLKESSTTDNAFWRTRVVLFSVCLRRVSYTKCRVFGFVQFETRGRRYRIDVLSLQDLCVSGGPMLIVAIAVSHSRLLRQHVLLVYRLCY